jgi:hypothetical protein
MAKPSEKLAESLNVLHNLQERGLVAIRSGDLTRTHRERLSQNGFFWFPNSVWEPIWEPIHGRSASRQSTRSVDEGIPKQSLGTRNVI